MATNLTTRETAPARRLALGWDAAMDLAATEYDRVATLLGQLEPAQWAAPTDCPAWDVRAMAGHMLGMAQMVATPAEMERQQVASHEAAARSGTSALDALTALQVEQNKDLDTAELVQQMRTVAPQAASSRRQTPAEHPLIRRRGRSRVRQTDVRIHLDHVAGRIELVVGVVEFVGRGERRSAVPAPADHVLLLVQVDAVPEFHEHPDEPHHVISAARDPAGLGRGVLR